MIFGMDTASFFGIILLIVGFVFVGIEIVVPGFSWPGVFGIISFVAAVFLLTEDFITGLLISLCVVAVLCFLLIFLFDRLAKGKFKSPIVLKESTNIESGFISSGTPSALLGKSGVLLTDLRPVGKAEIEGAQYDVMSEGEFMKKGEEITVLEVKNTKIIVRPAAKATSSSSNPAE